jgi:hypothetical protein
MPIFGEDDFNRGAFSTHSVGSNAGLDAEAEEDLPLTVEEAMPTVEALRYTHPDYDHSIKKWIKYLNLYESENVSDYIHKHPREHEESHALRVKRGYYYNYVATVVDLFTAFLYRAPVVRSFSSEFSDVVKSFRKDVDRCGTEFTSFMAKVCTYAKLQGHGGILVDAARAVEGQEALTAADDKDEDLLPFLTHIYAHQIMDWKLDRFGNFDWVKLRVSRPQVRDWNTTVSDTYEVYQIWDREMWHEFAIQEKLGDSGPEEEVIPLGSGEHDLGKVPLVIVRTDKSTHPWFGSSVVRDIADINIAILNWSSLQDEEIYNRALNVLTMQADDDSKPVEIGHYNVIEYPEGAPPPQYLVPGATPLEQIRASIADARDEIRRLAKMNISTGFSDVRQASSGIAHAFQFIEANQNLSNKSLALQNAEKQVFDLVAKYVDIDMDAETQIEYAKEFGIEDYNMLLTEIATMSETVESESAWKELQKDYVRRRFNTADADLLKKMEKEIEAAEKPTPEDFGLPSFTGGAGDGAANEAGSEKSELVENQSPEPGEDPGPVTRAED